MPNSMDFYKGVFLHVIPVRIIVPWVNQHLIVRSLYSVSINKILVNGAKQLNEEHSRDVFSKVIERLKQNIRK